MAGRELAAPLLRDAVYGTKALEVIKLECSPDGADCRPSHAIARSEVDGDAVCRAARGHVYDEATIRYAAGAGEWKRLEQQHTRKRYRDSDDTRVIIIMNNRIFDPTQAPIT